MNKYINPKSYSRQASKLANNLLLATCEDFVAPSAEAALRYPPIFFLGAPRSGSTLVMQVITDALDLGYISNRHCQWYGAPWLAEKLFGPTRHRPISDFESRQGVTEGWHAPAECGSWWYRFFRRKPSYVGLDEVDARKMRQFRRAVAALTNAFDRPVLFKNLYASLRIQAIAYHLPESVFITIHRDEIDNGHSLLETRRKVFNDYNAWWSMEPPEIEFLETLPVHEQVIEQIRHIRATIERDLSVGGVAVSRRFDLRYEDFCEDPPKWVGAIQDFLTENGCPVERREVEIPDAFNRRAATRIDRALYSAMVGYARQR